MKIIFLGDSITRGIQLAKNTIWTSYIAEQNPNDTIINKGIAGDTSIGMLTRLQTDVISQSPDLLHIMGGLNDLVCGVDIKQIQCNLHTMCQHAKAHQIKPIIGVSPLPTIENVPEIWKTFADFDHINNELTKLQLWIREYVTIFPETAVIDYAYEFNRQSTPLKELYLDGIHFNERGNQLLAEIFLTHLAGKTFR